MGFTSSDIEGFDFVQHFVGNAKYAAIYYANLFGFKIAGYMGPETGVTDRVSYLLTQNDLIFAVTAAIQPNHYIQDFVRRHGDGVGEISIRVKNPAEAYEYALNKGAKSVAEPMVRSDENGSFQQASIALYGDTVLNMVNRRNYRGFLPGYGPYSGPQFAKKEAGLIAVDHIVGNVDDGHMNSWADFFEEKLDLETYIEFDDGDISTRFSALRSKVVRSKNSAVKFPINEPADGLKKSQIEEYLEVNHGAGVQHIALATEDMVATISALLENGVEFIETPASYYDLVQDRLAKVDEDLDDLERLNILVDDEGEGYLLQLFTKPVGDRPTLFYEIIQRKGSEGFGQNNFQSLFESIEREQALRGNL